MLWSFGEYLQFNPPKWAMLSVQRKVQSEEEAISFNNSYRVLTDILPHLLDQKAIIENQHSGTRIMLFPIDKMTWFLLWQDWHGRNWTLISSTKAVDRLGSYDENEWVEGFLDIATSEVQWGFWRAVLLLHLLALKMQSWFFPSAWIICLSLQWLNSDLYSYIGQKP